MVGPIEKAPGIHAAGLQSPKTSEHQREMPQPKPYEQQLKEEFEAYKKTVADSIDDTSKCWALGRLGSIARSTHDTALALDCVGEIGAVLTSPKGEASTTMREAAASALGTTRNAKALDYLELALEASDQDKVDRYVTTVRSRAVGSLGTLLIELFSPDKEGKASMGKIKEILEYVVANDKYNHVGTAKRLLASRKWA